MRENGITCNYYNFFILFVTLESFVIISLRDKQFDNSSLKHGDENYKHRIVNHFVFTFATQSNLPTTGTLGTGEKYSRSPVTRTLTGNEI